MVRSNSRRRGMVPNTLTTCAAAAVDESSAPAAADENEEESSNQKQGRNTSSVRLGIDALPSGTHHQTH